MPVMKVRYPGTMGSTHGEANERKPARRAIPSPISIVVGSLLGWWEYYTGPFYTIPSNGVRFPDNLGPSMAERGGFEPPMPEGIHDFESCAINRTLPPLRKNLTIGHFCSLGKDQIAPDEEHLYHENISLEETRMNGRMLRFGFASLIALVLLRGTVSVFAQVDTSTQPEFGPPLRPLIKLIGF